MAKDYFKAVEKSYNKYVCTEKILREACEAYLMDELEANDGDITISEEKVPTVAYDGGNHPEYASSLSTTCYSVYSENGNIVLRIEETDEYYADNVPTSDLYEICNAVFETLKDR
jgi:hypothetical protein